MKTGTLILLVGIAALAVKSGMLGRLASAAPDISGGGGLNVPSESTVQFGSFTNTETPNQPVSATLGGASQIIGTELHYR